jgi:hypothetical protein
MANFENMNRTFNAQFKETMNVGQGGTGADGADGASAYEIAVKNGFKGSETEWLESLKGEPGQPGKDGQNGADGKTPVKGLDYFTQADVQEIAEQAAALVEVEVPDTYTRQEIDTIMGAYINDIDTLVGGGS